MGLRYEQVAMNFDFEISRVDLSALYFLTLYPITNKLETFALNIHVIYIQVLNRTS